MVEKRRSLKERIDAIEKGWVDKKVSSLEKQQESSSLQNPERSDESFPTTSDDKLLAGVANAPQAPVQKQGVFSKIVPILAFVLILGLLGYLLLSSGQLSMTSAATGLTNQSDYDRLQTLVSEQQNSIVDCNNRLLNCSAFLVQPCPVCEDPNPECISELATANIQLASLKSVDPECETSLDTTIAQRDSFSRNFTSLNSSFYSLNSAFIHLNSSCDNLSKNFTVLNSSYMNCTANSTGNYSWFSNWSICNSSYFAANVTIVNNLNTISSLNATLLTANSTILSLSSLNSYLMSNMTCFACWKGQNYTRYFWNDTSRELMCTNITWYTLPVNMGAC